MSKYIIKTYNIFILIIVYFSINTCSFSEKEEDSSTQIKRLLDDEKYDTAHLKIKDKLSSKKKDEDILTEKSTKELHLLELSNDRNRIVYTDDKAVYFRDLANPLVKVLTFAQLPVNLSISSDAEHAIISIALPNGVGCRLLAITLLESREAFVAKSLVPCNQHAGITSDGSFIYYFMDDSLYMESVTEDKSPKLVIDKKKFQPVASGIKNKYYLYPIGKTFLIFAGNAGLYHLYWLDPKKNEEERIADDIATPKIYYGNGKSAYIITGAIGNLFIQELKLSAYGRPVIADKISTNNEKINPWPTSIQDEFISSFEGEVFRWKDEKKIKIYPIISNSIWLAARDQIIYLDNNNNLLITPLEFSEEDYKLLELYQQTKR